MLLIRDLFYAKPGKVRPLVEKMIAMSKISERRNMGKMRIMTDVSAERFWTVVSEFETESFDKFMTMDVDEEAMKEFDEIMKDYHDFVDSGRREIYKIEH
jgi:hypothetical protein